MSKVPFFSIITASYNSEKTIDKTIESLLNQNYTNFEYIIIDGNSKDSTLEIIKSFEQKFKEKNITYKFISEPDKGIYDAWNKGIKLSEGEWISFLGSDDYYLSDALKLYYNTIVSQPNEINFVSSKINIINKDQKVLNVFGKKFIYSEVIRDMRIAQVGSFHNKILFEKLGLFSTEYKIVGDLEFYSRTKNIINAGFLNTITAYMLNDGVSSQIYKSLREAKNLKLRKQLLPTPIIYLYYYKSLLICNLKKIIRR